MGKALPLIPGLPRRAAVHHTATHAASPEGTSAADVAAALDQAGAWLKRLRTQRRMTLTGVVKATGISKSIVLGEQDWVLGPGEVASFDTAVPHWFGSTPCPITGSGSQLRAGSALELAPGRLSASAAFAGGAAWSINGSER